MQTSQRLVRGALLKAERCEPVFGKARTSKNRPAQSLGIRYERQVHKALDILAKQINARVEHNPWFHFYDDNGHGACSTDSILWLNNLTVIIEVKYTWVPTAGPKLLGLYIPVIKAALAPTVVHSIVICKTLTSESPRPIERLRDSGPLPSVYQWIGKGPIQW